MRWAGGPQAPLWALFSFEAAKVAIGAESYRWRQDDHLPILETIYQRYRETGIPMSYTFQDFRHDVALEMLDRLTPDERLRGLPLEERLRGLPPEELARRLPPEERLRGLPPEERLRGLSDEELDRLEDLLERRKSGRPLI